MRLLYLPRFTAASEASNVLSYVFRGIAILICGVGGAWFAWTLVDALGWTGVDGAIVTAIIGMIAATLLWAAGVALGKALRLIK
jgi:hypothetical protein